MVYLLIKIPSSHQINEQTHILEKPFETLAHDYPSPPPSALEPSATTLVVESREISENTERHSPLAPPTKLPGSSKISISLTPKIVNLPSGPRINPLREYGKNQDLVRKLWDVRREIVASTARESSILEQLEKRGVPISLTATNPSMAPAEPEREVEGQS